MTKEIAALIFHLSSIIPALQKAPLAGKTTSSARLENNLFLVLNISDKDNFMGHFPSFSISSGCMSLPEAIFHYRR